MKNQEVAWLLHEKYQGVESDAFFADCGRLEAGEPLAYVIGSIPFLDCVIHLASKPLIPRPETEYWVEKAIAAIKLSLEKPNNIQPLPRTPLGKFPRGVLGRGLGSPLRVLDLCAGSGCIGVAVAKAISDASVTFIELDATHLPTIKKNLETNLNKPSNRLEGFAAGDEMRRYQIYTGNLFAALQSEPDTALKNDGFQFDFILTNPPYIDEAANTAETSVIENEPHLALFGGTLGMDIIARIIAEAPQYLTVTGQLWIEHEPAQVDAIAVLGNAAGFTTTTHEDQYHTARYSVLTRSVPE